MCGIIVAFNTNTKGKKNKKPEKVNQCILDQYQDQCGRGQKGFGIIRINQKGNLEVDRATEEIKFLLDLYLKPSNMIIAHHRQPTSTENKISQTHPIFITNKKLEHDYYFIHNGMVSNDTELHKKHEAMGFKYITEYEKESYISGRPGEIKYNDTEALGIEIVLLIENLQATVETNSSAAFFMLQVDKKTHKATKAFFGRSGTSSCLNMFKEKGILRISSVGEGDEIEAEKLFSFNTNDPEMKITTEEMIFKKIETIPVRNHMSYDFKKPDHLNLPITKTIQDTDSETNTKKTTAISTLSEKEIEMVTMEERPWVTSEQLSDPYASWEEEAFVDKNYKEERCPIFKEELKTDDSEMIESSLDTALDDEVERIGKIMINYQKTLMLRKIDGKERSYYLSQTYQILRAMEGMADIAQDIHEEKVIEEEKKAREEDFIDDHQVGFRMGRKVHNYRTGEYEDVPGHINFED